MTVLGRCRHIVNFLCLAGCVALAVLFGLTKDSENRLYLLLGNAGVSGFIGWHLIMGIGGADMPVVVSMLNSYSGWATAASGFLLKNLLLIVTGALVGSSGAILSYIMCRAMNRSFLSVLAGGFGEGAPKAPRESLQGKTFSTDMKETTKWLIEAKKVVIVPGYGMAVARCQHDIGTLAKILKNSGRTVEFCIHPVAGRLPGHMNVLLAEADVDYNIVKEMSEVNPHLADTDLVLVIGANDIVNPDAEEDVNSPIAGMPVCQVWKAKHTIVFKRGAGRGYSDIENPLFFKENTRMYYGSADKSIKEILNEITANQQDFESNEYSADLTEDLGESRECETVQYETYITIGVPKENRPEHRVAVTPSMVQQFNKRGFSLKIETGAGDSADFTDNDYKVKGAAIVPTVEVWNTEIILKVLRPTGLETQNLANTKLLVCYLAPGMNEN